jgi:secondary thiamine-phosphate synthase enzyme
VKTTELTIDTSGRELLDLTAEIREFCSAAGDGLVNVFVPHATAGLAIIEVDSGSEEDLGELLERLFPKDARYQHSHGARGHGADHLTPTVFSPSLTIPVLDGAVQFGTWQSVVLVDRNPDNPTRHVRLTFVPA